MWPNRISRLQAEYCASGEMSVEDRLRMADPSLPINGNEGKKTHPATDPDNE
jgi:hypothetical protein